MFPDVLCPVDLDGVGCRQHAMSGEHGDAPALDEPGQALVQTTDDAVLVLVDTPHIDAVERDVDAELLALARLVGDLTGVQQGLGGDAPAMQTGAAELVLLHQPDGQPQLRGAEGAGIAPAATAEDDYVEFVACAVGHDASGMRVGRVQVSSCHLRRLPPTRQAGSTMRLYGCLRVPLPVVRDTGSRADGFRWPQAGRHRMGSRMSYPRQQGGLSGWLAAG